MRAWRTIPRKIVSWENFEVRCSGNLLTYPDQRKGQFLGPCSKARKLPAQSLENNSPAWGISLAEGFGIMITTHISLQRQSSKWPERIFFVRPGESIVEYIDRCIFDLCG